MPGFVLLPDNAARAACCSSFRVGSSTPLLPPCSPAGGRLALGRGRRFDCSVVPHHAPSCRPLRGAPGPPLSYRACTSSLSPPHTGTRNSGIFSAPPRNAPPHAWLSLRAWRAHNQPRRRSSKLSVYSHCPLSPSQPEGAFDRTVRTSMVVSADVAHAVHPNYCEKHDESHQMEMAAGPVLKFDYCLRSAVHPPARCVRPGAVVHAHFAFGTVFCG